MAYFDYNRFSIVIPRNHYIAARQVGRTTPPLFQSILQTSHCTFKNDKLFMNYLDTFFVGFFFVFLPLYTCVPESPFQLCLAQVPWTEIRSLN